MDDTPARFRPTWQQVLGHAIYLGVLASVAAACLGFFLVAAICSALHTGLPPVWAGLILALGPVALGAVVSVRAVRRLSPAEDDSPLEPEVLALSHVRRGH